MSVTISLTSVAILAGVTLSTNALIKVVQSMSEKTQRLKNEAQITKKSQQNTDILQQPLETMFVDCELLSKTLREYGCVVNVISENEITVITECGNMKYIRENQSCNFSLLLDEITNPHELVDELKIFEECYGRNVQAYTYEYIKRNLKENMSLEDESFEDDCLVLTIDV